MSDLGAAVAGLGPAAGGWFSSNFEEATPVQKLGWPKISGGQNVLLLAPTGSGKTLAAFLACIDRLVTRGEPLEGTSVLYVSPLKALVYDIERNLRAPLAGVVAWGQRQGLAVRIPTVGIRTGDTSGKERQMQARKPPDILVTTPESLYLMLGSRMSASLAAVETVIVDEIHSLAPTKRGAHLSLSLERLERCTGKPLQRIGLSATVDPVEGVARYLGGARPVEIVNTLEPPRLDLRIVVPVEDMQNPTQPPATPQQGESLLGILAAEEKLRQAGGAGHGMAAEGAGTLWSSIYPKILELVGQHRSTIIFVNSRGLCERLALRLNELAEREVARSHHGSLSHQERQNIEEMLKAGQIPALVATSSLELGIDMGSVDLVILVESPGSVARGLQRVGRAGHGVGQISQARIFPKFPGDLVECTVVAHRMRQGRLEPIRIPDNPLDVLAQQLVAMICAQDWTVGELLTTVQGSANYARLSPEVLREVLDMLSGRYPSSEFADLKPRINWDREKDQVSARPGARTLAAVNGGTIPDRGLYRVVFGPGGPRVGELDEEMVHEIRSGQNFLLGASTWRVEEITKDSVIVSAAPGEPGRMPFWRGDGPGRPIEVGLAMGAFLREMGPRLEHDARESFERVYGLDGRAASNLHRYLKEQVEATGQLPHDRSLIVETFRDEIGDWRVCLLSPLGARVHAPWALALEAQFARQHGFEVQAMWTDDGIVLRFADVDELPPLPDLAPDPEELQELLLHQLGQSALFAGQFRENAGRALLLPRKMPGQRTPLWAQRLRAQNLLAVARQYPSFPIVLETYRSCLQDHFDVPSLKEVLRDIRSRRIRLHRVETERPSPFARSLVFHYVAAYLYQGDAPLAERRAQALTLDRSLLAELLGQEELRELLDPVVLAELEEELQRLLPERRARHLDDVHDLLRQLGALPQEEVARRCGFDLGQGLSELERARRLCRLRWGGRESWVAVEDVSLYRDALAVQPPSGLPAVFLESRPEPLQALLTRWARVRGPFTLGEASQHFALPASLVESELGRLVAAGRLQVGDFRPGGHLREWCDSEVLRRWRRRTLARLRHQVAPVEASAMARLLWRWQARPGNLEEALRQLEGLPLSFQELEKSILPARLPGYQTRWLDDLGQRGLVIWVGCGALGNRDGKIALCRRERAGLLLPLPRTEELEGIHRDLVELLQRRGASFLMELTAALRDRYRNEEVQQALEDLIWSGVVTNDLFSPLRGLGGSVRRRGSTLAGRWTLVEPILRGFGTPTETQIRHAWVQTWLDRYGLVSREVAAAESLSPGYAALYPVLKAMEESGKARRGYFVEGLRGSQFAWSGAVDQLRRPCQEDEPATWVLASTDPMNPFGCMLPWPTNNGRPRRAVGSRLILVRGEPALYLERGSKKVLTFPAMEDPQCASEAAQALFAQSARAKGRCLRLEEINGAAAHQSTWSRVLKEAGFREDYTGLMAMDGAPTYHAGASPRLGAP